MVLSTENHIVTYNAAYLAIDLDIYLQIYFSKLAR